MKFHGGEEFQGFRVLFLCPRAHVLCFRIDVCFWVYVRVDLLFILVACKPT